MTSPTREIRDLFAGQIILIWIFAIVWNLFLGSMSWLAFRHGIDEPMFYVVFGILGACGLGLLFGAIYLTAVELRFGRSVFEMQTLLSVPGGVVTGAIRVPRPFTCREGIDLRLVCLSGAPRRFAGRDRLEVNSVVWEERCTLDQIPLQTRVSHIPICFRIPSKAQPSDNSKTGFQLLWRLEAKARTGGIPYAASFLIPVFAGVVPPELRTVHDPTSAWRSRGPARRQLMNRHIHVTAFPGGGIQCELSPGRNLSMAALWAGLFAPGLGGFGVFIFFQMDDAKDVFDRLFSAAQMAFGILIIAVGLSMLGLGIWIALNRVTIIVRDGKITVRSAIGVFGRTKEIPFSQIEDFAIGSDGSLNTQIKYCVNAVRKGAKPVALCGLIDYKADAEWLAAEFKKEIAAK